VVVVGAGAMVLGAGAIVLGAGAIVFGAGAMVVVGAVVVAGGGVGVLGAGVAGAAGVEVVGVGAAGLLSHAASVRPAATTNGNPMASFSFMSSPLVIAIAYRDPDFTANPRPECPEIV
jgi:hypothetical protein